MRKTERYRLIRGSKRSKLETGTEVAPIPQDARAELTVVVRRKRAIPGGLIGAFGHRHPLTRKYLERSRLANLYGADANDFARIKAFAARYGLSVTSQCKASRSLTLSGNITDINRAFQVDLKYYYQESDPCRPFLARR